MEQLQSKVKDAKTCPTRDNPYFDMCRIIGSPDMVTATYTFPEYVDKKCDLPKAHVSAIIPGCEFVDLFIKEKISWLFFLLIKCLQDKRKEKTSLLLPITLEYLKDLVSKFNKEFSEIDLPDIAISKDEDLDDKEFIQPKLTGTI